MSRTHRKTARMSHLHVDALEGRQMMTADVSLKIVGIADVSAPLTDLTKMRKLWSEFQDPSGSKELFGTFPKSNPSQADGDRITKLHFDSSTLSADGLGRMGTGSFDLKADSRLADLVDRAIADQVGLEVEVRAQDASGQIKVVRFDVDFTSIAADNGPNGAGLDHVEFGYTHMKVSDPNVAATK